MKEREKDLDRREKKQKENVLQDRTRITNSAVFSSSDCGVSRPRGGRAVFRQVLTLTTPPHTKY